MSRTYVLYNPKSDSGKGREEAEAVKTFIEGDVSFVDAFAEGGYAEFLKKTEEGDTVVLCGGDGTLNRFINDTCDEKYAARILYFATGTGNDFMNDLGKKSGSEPIDISKYIVGLPVVTVKGKEYRFLNGVGYGIDGYCCEVGDAQREAGVQKINYTGIAIKGLLFHYKPTNAKITIDGKTMEFKKVWLAPTMNGRYYGGGMIPTPDQDRLNNDTVSTMVFYGKGKIKTLMAFPSIFKGEHVKHTDMVKIFTGKEVKVDFDRPTALQIDGETILGVTSYSVKTKAVI